MSNARASHHFRQALACLHRSDVAAAIDHYREALAADPEFAPASVNLSALANQYYNLGCTHQRNGLVEDAVDAYRLALSADPADHEAQFNLATLSEELGRTDDAVAGYRATLAMRPDYRKAVANLVRLLQSVGEGEQAAKLVRDGYRDFELSATGPAHREIDLASVADAAPDRIIDALAAYGVLVVRGLYDEDTIAWCDTLLERVDRLPGRDIFPLHDMIDQDGMDRLVPAILGSVIDRLSLSRKPSATSFIRRVAPSERSTHVRYHQDSLAFVLRCLNVWVPLVACGHDAPGLEVVARRTGELLPTVSTDDNSLGRVHSEIDPGTVSARYQSSEIWAPHFAVGDVMVQLGTTIHRSHIVPGMTKRRISIEMRFAE